MFFKNVVSIEMISNYFRYLQIYHYVSLLSGHKIAFFFISYGVKHSCRTNALQSYLLIEDSNMDPNNSCIRLLAPSVMHLSIQEGKIFGEGPPLQTLAPNKWPTLNAILFATETVPKAGLCPMLSFPKKN